MMRNVVRVLGPAAVLAILSGPALAQDISWAAGTWKGRLESFRGQDPERVMIIDIAGGKPTCRWGEGYRASPAPASCTVTANEIKLTTGAKNPVELRRDGKGLAGTWTGVGSGRSFRVTMTKE
ncbi:hypothetical protein [Reyranella sp. CPCC 100927]|uniref:hypothetical protein n=1 Tax=Reyranella sp. CPCC 100927 TaxID=2599616 RepID=UPI0011B7E63F|nr:hypothetical protein [Reyranella sp. CPCC 100927]TWS98311.1 hypothetical protein FQU96_36425 [Reyranella sp. CPCC 100927]